jgi:hypothetical protein
MSLDHNIHQRVLGTLKHPGLRNDNKHTPEGTGAPQTPWMVSSIPNYNHNKVAIGVSIIMK